MTAPTFTPPPTAPSRGDASTFSARFAAWLAWIATFTGQLISGASWMDATAAAAAAAQTAAEAAASTASAAAAAALGVTTRVGTSPTSNTVGSGPKTFAINESGRTLHQCVAVLVGATADLDSRMYLVINAGSSSAGSIAGTVATDGYVIGPGGAGPYTSWTIIDAFYAQQGADAADLLAATASHLAIAPKVLKDAMATLSLTDASTVAWDTNLGTVASVTLTANGHQIGAPTNLKANWPYVLYVNPGAYTCSWNAVWDWGAASAPNLPASAWSRVEGRYNAALGKIQVSLWRGA